jgi:hypothetical protein
MNQNYSEKGGKKMTADIELARELDLYQANDQELYRTYTSWVLNYKRKMKKGVYDRRKAVIGLANNYVPQIARKYRKEVSPLPNIDRETKIATAKMILESIESDIKDGFNG